MLVQQFIEILVVHESDLGYCVGNEVYEMSAFENAAIVIGHFVAKNFLDIVYVINQIENSQGFDSFNEALLVTKQTHNVGKDIVKVRVRRLQTIIIYVITRL